MISYTRTLVWGSLAVGGVTLVLLLKRLDRATNPPRPPHVYSILPFVGSALAMTQTTIRDFIQKHSHRLQSPVFTAWIAGRHCTFLADSDLVYIVFKDHMKQIDSYSLQRKAMVDVMGVTESIAEETLTNQEIGKPAMAQIHKYLVTKDPLEQSIQAAQDVLWEKLKNVPVKGDTWHRVPLLDFCSRIVYAASVEPLISKGLVTDELYQEFKRFDQGFPLLFGDAPSIMTRSTRQARAKMVQALQRPNVQNQFSDFMKDRQQLLEAKVGKPNFAKFNLGVLLASVSNSMPGVFWTLYNIVNHPEAYQACRAAVDTVQAQRESGRYTFTLEELDQLSVITSAFHETLRLRQHFFIVRDVLEDFVLKTKKGDFSLQKGTCLMAFPHTVHMDPDIFDHPEEFRYDRFVDPNARAPQGGLLRHYLKPFGGGAHACPGRSFITRETEAFVAMILLQLDVRLPDEEKGQPLGIVRQRQGASVAHPDRDPIVEIRLRQH